MKKELIKTFSVNSGDGTYIYEDFESMKEHLDVDIEEWEKRAKSMPEKDESDTLDITLTVQYKYTQEEVDNLPEP